MVPLSMTLSDLWTGFQGHDILWCRISEKRYILKILTIAQEESITNIWNGTMFGDLDWPLDTSRGFVSISWASCLDIRHQKCSDLENRVPGPSWSLEMSPFDRAHDFLLKFCSNYGSIPCRLWDIQCRKMSWSWNWGQRSLKVIESATIR